MNDDEYGRHANGFLNRGEAVMMPRPDTGLTFEELRADFIIRRKGSLALPITGLLVYAAAALLSLVIDPVHHNLLLAIAFWTIPPIGAVIGRVRGEELGSPTHNPLFRLSALARIMALSTWAIHVPVWIYAPELFPISIGIGFAIHWVVFSWTIGHPLGIIHLALRIIFVLGAWHLCPENRVGAVCAGVALAYAISLLQLRAIDWQRRLGLAENPPDC